MSPDGASPAGVVVRLPADRGRVRQGHVVVWRAVAAGGLPQHAAVPRRRLPARAARHTLPQHTRLYRAHSYCSVYGKYWLLLVIIWFIFVYFQAIWKLGDLFKKMIVIKLRS